MTMPSPDVTVPGPEIVFNGAGSKPVSAVPGLTPTSPVMSDAPSLVTVVAPRTANVDAVPKGTDDDVAVDLFRPCGPPNMFGSPWLDGAFDSHAANRNATEAIDERTTARVPNRVNNDVLPDG